MATIMQWLRNLTRKPDSLSKELNPIWIAVIPCDGENIYFPEGEGANIKPLVCQGGVLNSVNQTLDAARETLAVKIGSKTDPARFALLQEALWTQPISDLCFKIVLVDMEDAPPGRGWTKYPRSRLPYARDTNIFLQYLGRHLPPTAMTAAKEHSI